MHLPKLSSSEVEKALRTHQSTFGIILRITELLKSIPASEENENFIDISNNNLFNKY